MSISNSNSVPNFDIKGRREFVIKFMKAAAGTSLLMLPGVSIAGKIESRALTVQQV